MIPVLGLPYILLYAQHKIGRKKLIYSLIPTIIFSFLVYYVLSSYYYLTQTHLFDPFLQAPPPPIDQGRLERSNDVYRIVTIGGSTTLNKHLIKEQRYPTLLESILREKYPESKIDVFNSGMDWWTTKHSLINYVTNVHNWEPDLVIVMHAINDLYRSFSPEGYTVGDYDPSWTHFYGPAIFGANPPSYLGHINRRYFRRILWRWYPSYRYIEVDYPVEHYVSIEQFEENLRSLIHYVRSDGVDLILITQPSILKETMTKDERNILKFGFAFCITRQNWLKSEYPSPRSLSAAMNAFNSVIRHVAEEEDIPFVDLTEVVPRTLEYFVDDVHYTPVGSELVAQTIANAIDNLELVISHAVNRSEDE
jgi:lysophospholipase L1-like esterase